MDLDIITFILLVTVMGYLAVSRFKMLKEHRSSLDLAKERKDMQKIFTGQLITIMYIIMMVISLIGLIYVIFNRDVIVDSFSWILLLIVVFVTAAIDLLRVKVMYTAYYNDHGMFINQDYIRYNSIKNYAKKGLAIVTTVNTFNGGAYIVPTKTLDALDSKIAAKRKK